MLKAQGGVCKLCGSPPKLRSLHTDHRHVLGFRKLPPEEKRKCVRGLLCYPCNKYKVGKLNLEWANKIRDYLMEYEPNPMDGTDHR